MNTIQLKIRRLLELQSAVRESRHILHAQRVPLAKALRLAIRADKLITAANNRLERVDEGVAVVSPPRDLLDWHYTQVDMLNQYQAEITHRIATLQKDKTAQDELGKAAKRRAERKATEKKRKRK